jgi:hypothetical protein
MYLTSSNLAHYLTARGLVATESVASGEFVVLEAGRRNRNFMVMCGNRRGLFVKQPQSTEPQAVATLARESRVYLMARELSSMASVARLAPGFVDYNPDNHCLVLDLKVGWENLTEFHTRTRIYSPAVAEQLARALAQYHAAGARILRESVDLSVFPKVVPWVLTVDPGLLLPAGSFGAAGATLGRLLANYPGLAPSMGTLAREWNTDGLIHGDMKWDNIIVRVEADGRTDVRIVDWELADLGDTYWDVASIWAAYVAGLAFNPAVGTPDSSAAGGQSPELRIQAIRPTLLGFWRTYVEQRGIKPDEEIAQLARSLRFCAARLVLLAFECLHNTPADLEIPNQLLLMSSRMLAYPDAAMNQLFGTTP